MSFTKLELEYVAKFKLLRRVLLAGEVSLSIRIWHSV